MTTPGSVTAGLVDGHLDQIGRGLERAREAEVEDLECAIRHDEQVGRLHVTVDDPAIVRRTESARGLHGAGDRLAQRRTSFSEHPVERLPLESLRDDVRRGAIQAGVVQDENVWMRQRGDGFGFAFESRPSIGIGGQVLRQDLDGDVAIEPGISRTGDLSLSGAACVRKGYPKPAGRRVCGGCHSGRWRGGEGLACAYDLRPTAIPFTLGVACRQARSQSDRRLASSPCGNPAVTKKGREELVTPLPV